MPQSLMLARHGTNPNPLPLGAIVGAARRDLEILRLKREDMLERGAPYAFHPRHVRKAASASELLLIAAQVPHIAERTSLANRALLYRDPERLVDAAEHVMQAGGGSGCSMSAHAPQQRTNGARAPKFHTGISRSPSSARAGQHHREMMVRITDGRFLPSLAAAVSLSFRGRSFLREVTR